MQISQAAAVNPVSTITPAPTSTPTANDPAPASPAPVDPAQPAPTGPARHPVESEKLLRGLCRCHHKHKEREDDRRGRDDEHRVREHHDHGKHRGHGKHHGVRAYGSCGGGSRPTQTSGSPAATPNPATPSSSQPAPVEPAAQAVPMTAVDIQA
jgi:hypothetical protein